MRPKVISKDVIRHTEHLSGHVVHFFGGIDQFDASFETRREVAATASSGQHLRFDHEVTGGEFARDIAGLLRRLGDAEARDGHSPGAQDVQGHVFLHVEPSATRELKGSRGE